MKLGAFFFITSTPRPSCGCEPFITQYLQPVYSEPECLVIYYHYEEYFVLLLPISSVRYPIPYAATSISDGVIYSDKRDL